MQLIHSSYSKRLLHAKVAVFDDDNDSDNDDNICYDHCDVVTVATVNGSRHNRGDGHINNAGENAATAFPLHAPRQHMCASRKELVVHTSGAKCCKFQWLMS